MSRLLKLILTLSVTTALFFPLNQAKAQDTYWTINNFSTDIVVNTDSSIVVTENIDVDFGSVNHHGIIREIPTDYTDKNLQQKNLRFTLLSVTTDSNRATKYQTYKSGHNQAIKIGDANTLINGEKTYIIKYKIDNALTFFQDHSELYWNATGNEWDVPINSAKATIHLPNNSSTNINAECYTGYLGSQDKNCAYKKNSNIIEYATLSKLSPNEGLTIVVGFPPSLTTKPSLLTQIINFLIDNWGYLIPFLTGGILYYLWKKKGKDPEVTHTAIVPLYEAPDGLSPCEVGTIIDETVDTKDITSTIIDLAVRGYLTITEFETGGLFKYTDYQFERLKTEEEENTLKPHEKSVLKGIFRHKEKLKKLSELNDVFYKTIIEVKDEVYSKLVENKYFPTNPEIVVKLYQGIGAGLLAGYIFAGGVIFRIIPNISINIGIIISSIIIILVAKAMPVKTVKGVETYYKILGLKEFINTAEKDRLKWQEQENIFEKLLPYAMVLDIADKWTQAFNNLNKTPPEWYKSTNPNFLNNYNTLLLLNHLNSLDDKAKSTLTSTPSSKGSSAWGGGSGLGGGGFSGGGFGGGGGSSW